MYIYIYSFHEAPAPYIYIYACSCMRAMAHARLWSNLPWIKILVAPALHGSRQSACPWSNWATLTYVSQSPCPWWPWATLTMGYFAALLVFPSSTSDRVGPEETFLVLRAKLWVALLS